MIVIRAHTAREVYLELIYLYATFKKLGYSEIGFELPNNYERKQLERRLKDNSKFRLFNEFVLVS